VEDSPIAHLLSAVDRFDVEAAMSLFAPDARILVADGRRAQGIDRVREFMTEFLAGLRSTTHRITAQWHPGDVWIAEVQATYELTDWRQLSEIPRAFIARQGPHGIAELRVYGAHEHSLGEHLPGERGLVVSGRWIPPL
jgi:SnoaL-like domain